MKKILTLIFSSMLVLSLMMALSSCKNPFKKEEEIPTPELDLDDAFDNLEDEGYDVYLYDEKEDTDPGEEECLYAYDYDHSEYYLKIVEYEDEELANLNYERYKQLLADRITYMEKEIAALKYMLENVVESDKYAEYYDEEEIEDLEEWIDEMEEDLEAYKKYVVGIDGCYVWFGHPEMIEDSKD